MGVYYLLGGETMKKLICLILIINFSCMSISFADSLSVNLSEEEKKWLTEHPVLYYAPDPEFAPYEYFDGEEFKGMISDYLIIIEELLGVEIEIVQTESWTETLDIVKKNEVDFVFLTRTHDRDEYLSFTDPFVTSPNIILVNEQFQKNVNVDNLEQYTVGLIKDYANVEYVKLIYPEAKMIIYPNISEGLKELSFGNVESLIIDLGQGTYYINALNISNLRSADEIAYEYKLAFGTPHGKEILTSILNKTIKAIPKREHMNITDNWIQFQYKQWLNRDQIRLIYTASALLLLIVFGVVIWNKMLRRVVSQRTQELKLLNAELENKVAQRTAELKQ